MITKSCMACMLNELATKRPIFHSEADFQHELAWLCHLKYGNEYSVRLEKPEIIGLDHIAVDIVLTNSQGGSNVYLELKYKTAEVRNYNFNTELFNLKKQGAHNNACYDFCKDIQRVEQLTQNNLSYGYAIFLTNDMSYLRRPRSTAQYRSFSIHQGRQLTGNLDWIPPHNSNYLRSHNIQLNNSYDIDWEAYSTLPTGRNSVLKYLLVAIS